MAKNNDMNKGFTMAELLIVVAIIAVLVAIAIPVFSSQLKNARLAVDHSAMRDAYAIVQVANNTQEVEIDGEVKTFEQLDDGLATSNLSCMVCYLSKDCSSLIKASHLVSLDSTYQFREAGVNSSGICQTCEQWNNSSSDAIQPSQLHTEGNCICIVYDRDIHQLYLGYRF